MPDTPTGRSGASTRPCAYRRPRADAVFAVASGEVIAALARLCPPLGAHESLRLRRLRRPRDQASLLAARALTRICVARLHGGDDAAAVPPLQQRCDSCGRRDHGRPLPLTLDGRLVHVSWSHGGNEVCAAASTWPVGCDIEQLAEADFSARDYVPEADATVSAAQFREAWCAGEALGKLATALSPVDALDRAHRGVGVWSAVSEDLDGERTAMIALPSGATRIHPYAAQPCAASGIELREIDSLYAVSKAATVNDALMGLSPAGRSASSWITRPSSRASS